MLRSKLRIAARQFHMSRLHPETWGERPQQENKANFDLLSKEELMGKARALLGMASPPKPSLVAAGSRAGGARRMRS